MVIQWRSLQNTGPKLARLLSGRFFLSGGNGGAGLVVAGMTPGVSAALAVSRVSAVAVAVTSLGGI